MPGNLLIASENGRAVQTYGVKRYQIHNMKFTLLPLVTLIFCSVCVCGDLEIFPGVAQRSSRSQDEDGNYSPLFAHPQWRASKPWINDEIDKELSAKVSERVRQLQELITIRRNQMKQEAAAVKNTYFRISDNSPNDDDLEFRKLSNKHYDQYQLKYPNQQILDDVRPYPHEDSDFSFHDDNDEDDSDDSDEALEDEYGQVEDVANLEKATPEASGKGALNEPELLKKPTEFAYAPPNPKFYEKTYEAQLDSEIKDENTSSSSTTDDDSTEDGIILDQRNGDKSLQQNYQDTKHQMEHRQQPNDNTVEVVAVKPHNMQDIESAGVYIIAIVAGISAAATVGLIAFAIGWYNLQKHVKNASDVEYPAYGVTGPNKEVSPSGDRRLAQSAQMYHYQHQKQQIIAMESRAAASDRRGSVSEADSDEENEEGDYTVYECPGLAPTGEMEVKNPLFQDDPTPAPQTPAPAKQPPGAVNGNGNGNNVVQQKK